VAGLLEANGIYDVKLIVVGGLCKLKSSAVTRSLKAASTAVESNPVSTLERLVSPNP
jgi:hypothetical protein